MVEEVTVEPVIGAIYEATVEKITNFGAFCEISPGKSGLVHVSEMSSGFVKNVSEHLKEGQVIKVKLIGIDEHGRINLSKRQAEENEEHEKGDS